MENKNGSFDFSALSFDQAPLIKVTPPGPESNKYLSFQSSHESSAVSYSRGMPMALKRGRGATLEDVDGNVFIDCFGGAGVMAVGHANPEVLEAAKAQIDNLTHALDIPNPARQALIETMFKFLPADLTRVFFGGPTGSDAVEQAMSMQLHYRAHQRPSISQHRTIVAVTHRLSGLRIDVSCPALSTQNEADPHAC